MSRVVKTQRLVKVTGDQIADRFFGCTHGLARI
jgi:hypothetical protein